MSANVKIAKKAASLSAIEAARTTGMMMPGNAGKADSINAMAHYPFLSLWCPRRWIQSAFGRFFIIVAYGDI